MIQNIDKINIDISFIIKVRIVLQRKQYILIIIIWFKSFFSEEFIILYYGLQ